MIYVIYINIKLAWIQLELQNINIKVYLSKFLIRDWIEKENI